MRDWEIGENLMALLIVLAFVAVVIADWAIENAAMSDCIEAGHGPAECRAMVDG